MSHSHKHLVWISGFLALVVFAISYDFPFFWDSIQLGSRQASHFYGGGGWLLPDEIDSGHPPGFGAYLAAWWSVFGRSLWVSHLAMFPWVWLLLCQLFILCKDLLYHHWYYLAPIVLFEPVLLGQIVLVSPDVVLVAAFMLGIRQAYQGPRRKNIYIFLSALALSLLSTRGWIAAFTVFLTCWLPAVIQFAQAPSEPEDERNPLVPTVREFTVMTGLQSLSLFLVAGVIALSYLYFHYQAKGWVGFHADSPWVGSFQRVGFSGMLRNLGVLGWRWLDLGRFMLWLLLPIAIFRHGWTIVKGNYVWWLPFFGMLVFQLLLLPLIVQFSGLDSPRYLLPAILLFNLGVGYAILFHHIPFDLKGNLREADPGRWQWVFYGLAVVSLFAGNFWIYPQRIAQGWDATPAHIPYYQQTEEAVDFLRAQNIPLSSVASVFPSVGPLDWTLLSNKENGFQRIATDEATYFYVSSVHNDWSDKDLDFIEARPILWQQTAWNGVTGTIYGH